MINIALSRTFSRASPICGVVSILPRVDLLENTEVDWFCILSLFRLDTLTIIIITIILWFCDLANAVLHCDIREHRSVMVADILSPKNVAMIILLTRVVYYVYKLRSIMMSNLCRSACMILCNSKQP